MATTTPSTEIRLLRGVRLTPSYNDTIYFANETAQEAYFKGKTHVVLSDYSFVRTKPNTVRVSATIQNCRTCNYIMIHNDGFFGEAYKYIYAFIVDVNYINNGTTEITYEIDYIQTFISRCSFGRCWIERNHTESDAIFFHEEPDYMPAGSEIVERNTRRISFDQWSAVFWVTEYKENGTWKTTTTYRNNRYIGAYVPYFFRMYTQVGVTYDYDDRGILDAGNFVQEYIDAGKVNSIKMITFYPTALINASANHIQYSGIVKPSANTPISVNVNDGAPDDSYTPVNNKLYSYPYNFLKLCSNSGEKTYRYEFMDDETLHIVGGVSPDASIYGFIGATSEDNNHIYNKYNNLSVGNLPQMSMNSDNFATWLAQNQIGIATQLFSNMASNNIMGGINQLQQVYQQAMFGGQTQISRSSNTTDLVGGNLGFIVKECHLDMHSIREVDDYFTKYGYAINKLRTPEFNNRPHYTYIKTRDAIVYGNNGYNANEKIADILNKGITFWKDGDEIGNYGVNNKPT